MAIPEGMEPEKDNIPATVDRIIELLNEAHSTVSRIKPEPPDEEKAPEQHGLEAAVVRARDKAGHLCKRLNEVANAVGAL